jgi:hypothetical protein
MLSELIANNCNLTITPVLSRDGDNVIEGKSAIDEFTLRKLLGVVVQ